MTEHRTKSLQFIIRIYSFNSFFTTIFHSSFLHRNIGKNSFCKISILHLCLHQRYLPLSVLSPNKYMIPRQSGRFSPSPSNLHLISKIASFCNCKAWEKSHNCHYNQFHPSISLRFEIIVLTNSCTDRHTYNFGIRTWSKIWCTSTI